MEATAFDTKPLLRPDQVEAHTNEIKSLEAKLVNPLIQDKGEVRKQLIRTKNSLEAQTPRAPRDGEEAGRMQRRSKELLDAIVPTMCSQEEMRKAPPGAVDKFRRGENSPAVKRAIAEWKNLQLRLTSGSGDREAANLERHRPKASTLNMDNAFIAGKQFFMPPADAGLPVIFSDVELDIVKSKAPEVADMLALMTNEQRASAKEKLIERGVLSSGIGLSEASKAGLKGAAKKRVLSEAQKVAMKAGAKAAREAKKAK